MFSNIRHLVKTQISSSSYYITNYTCLKSVQPNYKVYIHINYQTIFKVFTSSAVAIQRSHFLMQIHTRYRPNQLLHMHDRLYSHITTGQHPPSELSLWYASHAKNYLHLLKIFLLIISTFLKPI